MNTHISAGARHLNWQLVLAGVILALIGVRILYLILLGNTLTLNASGYDTYAENMRAGIGYTRFTDRAQDSDLPPLYPFFLMGVYNIAGRDAGTVAGVQIGLDVVTALALYGLGRMTGGARYGELVGVVGAALFAFYPYLLFQNLSVNDTGLFIALLATGIFFACRAGLAMRWIALAACCAGLCFGLAALTKSLVILVLPTLALWLVSRRGVWHGVLLSVIMGVSFSAVIIPWIVRNTTLHGSLVLVSTNDGSNLYQGNNPCVGDFMARGWDAQWVNCLNTPPPGLNEIAESGWMRDQALMWLRDNVSQWPRLFALKLWTTWTPELLPRGVPAEGVPRMINDAVLQYETPLFRAARIIHVLYLAPLFALALFGAWRLLRDKRPITPILAVLLAITVAYQIFHPSTRYRSPADPFVFILAAYGAAILLAWVRSRWRASVNARSL